MWQVLIKIKGSFNIIKYNFKYRGGPTLKVSFHIIQNSKESGRSKLTWLSLRPKVSWHFNFKGNSKDMNKPKD